MARSIVTTHDYGPDPLTYVMLGHGVMFIADRHAFALGILKSPFFYLGDRRICWLNAGI